MSGETTVGSGRQSSSTSVETEHGQRGAVQLCHLLHIIGASVSEPNDVKEMSTWTLSVCHGLAYGMATAHASHFLHVAVYVTMVTLFRR